MAWLAIPMFLDVSFGLVANPCPRIAGELLNLLNVIGASHLGQGVNGVSRYMRIGKLAYDVRCNWAQQAYPSNMMKLWRPRFAFGLQATRRKARCSSVSFLSDLLWVRS